MDSGDHRHVSPSSQLQGAQLGPQNQGSGPSTGTCPLLQPAPSLLEGLMEQTFSVPLAASGHKVKALPGP